MVERGQRRIRKPDVIVEQGKVKVTATIINKESTNTEDVKDSITEVVIFKTEPAYVRVSAGKTCNLGNYESLRVDVAITMPCYVEEVVDTQKKVADMVAAMLETELSSYLGAGDGGTSAKAG